MKNPSVFRALFALASISVLATVGGCSNFMSSDSDFKKKLTEEVKVANAPKIEVRIQADTGTGTVSPNGLTVVKVDVPFTITFQPAADYGFTGWAVFDIADPSEPLGAEIMTFVEKESPDGYTREVEARLLVNRPNLMVRPICVGRPTVTGTTPTSGRIDIVRNYPIKIFFSNKMDGASFLFDDGSSRKDGLFKNISITGLFGDPSTSEFRSYEEYYNPPTLNTTGSGNGKILTLSPVPGNLPPSYSVIRVTVKKDVKDSTGLSMAQDYIFDFTLGNSTDTKGPIMGAIQGGRAPNVYSFSTPSTRRVGSGPLYLTVEADDSLTGGGFVTMLSIKEERIKDRDGKSVSETETGWEDAPFTAEEGTQRSKLSYEIKGSQSGIYKLTIRALDSNQNWTADADAAVYHVVKDVDAPHWDPAMVTHSGGISGVDSKIWFNRDNQTLTLSPVSGGPVDVGVTGSDSGDVPGTTRSEEVQWRFSSVVAGNRYASSSWASVTSPLPYSLAGVPDSSSVSVQIELCDDLGNTFTPTQYTLINNDRTSPAAPGVAITPGVTLASGRKMIDATPAFIVTGSDAVSGAAKYLVNDTGVAPTEGTPGWTDFTSSPQTGTYSLSDTSEGPKTISVWLMDKAKNISLAGSDIAYLDNQPPSIQKFYVQKVDWTNKTVDPASAPDAQYANDAGQWVNFMIKATDAGSGIGSFMYEDVCSGTTIISGYFNAANNIVEQPSGSTAVRNIMVADLGSGVSLIFGQLKISSVNGTHAVTVKVKDYVNTESLATRANDNSLFYDNVVPTFSATPTFTGSGTGYYNDGTTLFVAATAQDVSVSLTDPGAAGTFSGLKELVFSGAVTASHVVAASTGTQTHSQTYPVTLSAVYGAKTINLSASDFAGNSVPATINAFLDNAPPTISTFNLVSTTGTAYGTYVYGNPFNGYVSATDPNAPASGLDTTAAGGHKIELYKQSAPTTLVQSVNIPLNTATSITLTDTKSDRYTAKALVYDRVGNVTTQEKDFHFDMTPPAWNTTTPLEVVDASGNPLGIFKGNTHYIPSTNFRIKAYVTDKPAADPSGSGLNAIRALYAVSVSGDSGNAVRSESAEVNPDDRWVYLPFNPSTNEWTAPSNLRLFVTSEAFDKVGLSSWSHDSDATLSTFIVVPDTTGPNITFNAFIPGISDVQGTTKYIKGDGFACSVTFTDNGPNSARSGVKAYAFSTNGVAPATTGVPAWNLDAAAYTASWTTYGTTGPWYRFTGTEGTAYEIGAQLLAFLEANQGQSVYVHAIDMLGNAGQFQIIDNTTDVFYVDRTSPVAALKINRLDEASIPALVNTHEPDGSSTYTTSLDVRVTVTINETGAGVKAITFTDFTPLTLETPITGSISGTTCTFGINEIPRGTAVQLVFTGTITGTVGNNIVVVDVLDRVTNPIGITSASIMYDTEDPAITRGAWTPSPGAGGGNPSYLSYFIKDGTTLSLSATDTNHVLRYVISQNATETASTIASGTAYNDGDVITPDISTYFNESTKTTLYFHVMDKAGRTRSERITSSDTTGYYLDATAPTISGVTVQGKVGSYLSSPTDLSLSFTATEMGSGIKTIKISGVADDTTGITVSGATLSNTTLPDWNSNILTIVLDNSGSARFPTPNGTSITVEGMTLLPNDGDKTVGVSVIDAVGFESAQVTDTFIFESTAPVVNNLWVRRADGITGNGNDGTHTSDSYTTNRTGFKVHIRFKEEGTGLSTINFAGSGLAFPGAVSVTLDGTGIAAPTASGTLLTFATPVKSRTTDDHISVLVISGGELTDSDASKKVTCIATDVAGNDSGSRTSYITLDREAPDIWFIGFTKMSTAAPWYVPGDSNIQAKANGDPTTYALLADSSATAPAAPAEASFSAYPGTGVQVLSRTYLSTTVPRYVYIYIRDVAGNIRVSKVYDYAVYLDETSPSGIAVATATPDGLYGGTYYYKTGGVDFTFSATEEGSGIAGYTTSSSGDSPQSSLILTTSASVYAVDRAGNVSSAISINVAADTTPPSTPAGVATSGVPTTYYRSDNSTYYFNPSATGASITLSATDVGSAIRGYSPNSDGSGFVGNPLILTSDKVYYAVDYAGNVSTPPISITVSTDAAGPLDNTTFNLGVLTSGIYTSDKQRYFFKDGGSKTFTPSATDNLSGVKGFYRNTDTPSSTISISSAGDKDINAVDNVGNVTTRRFYLVQDTTPPAEGTFGFSALGTGYYYRTDNATLYYKSGGSNAVPLMVTVTPTWCSEALSTTASGFAGYALSSSGTPGATIDLSSTGSKTLYAFDNVGNDRNKNFAYEADAAAPWINLPTSSNDYRNTISGISAGDALSQLKSFTAGNATVASATVWTDLTVGGGNTSISGLTALGANGNSDFIRVILEDNVGNKLTRIYKRTRNSENAYVLVQEGTDTTESRLTVAERFAGYRNTASGEKASAATLVQALQIVPQEETKTVGSSGLSNHSTSSVALPLSVQSSPARAVPVRLDSRSVQERHTAARTERAWAETGEQSVEKQEVTEPTEALPVDSVPTSVENVARPTQTDIPASGPQQNQGGNQDAPSNPSRAPDEPNSNRQPYCLPGRGRKQEEDAFEE